MRGLRCGCFGAASASAAARLVARASASVAKARLALLHRARLPAESCSALPGAALHGPCACRRCRGSAVAFDPRPPCEQRRIDAIRPWQVGALYRDALRGLCAHASHHAAARQAAQDPRTWAMSEAHYAEEMAAEMGLDAASDARQDPAPRAAAVQHPLDHSASQTDPDVLDDGTGRFFLKDASEMEEMVASSFTPSSRSFSMPVGDDGKHAANQGSLLQPQQAKDSNPAPACMMDSQGEDGENPLACRDHETHAGDAFSPLPQAPHMGKVSPYLEFQRAVLARSGASLRMPITEAGPHSLQEHNSSALGPLDVAESSDEAASSQVTPFEERMGACDNNGWYSNSHLAALQCPPVAIHSS